MLLNGPMHLASSATIARSALHCPSPPTGLVSEPASLHRPPCVRPAPGLRLSSAASRPPATEQLSSRPPRLRRSNPVPSAARACPVPEPRLKELAKTGPDEWEVRYEDSPD